MTASDIDVHGDRVEAAAMALAEVDGGNFFAEPVEYRDDAREILAAADAVVTVEKIAEVIDDLIDVPPRTTRLLADEIHALLTGEEA